MKIEFFTASITQLAIINTIDHCSSKNNLPNNGINNKQIFNYINTVQKEYLTQPEWIRSLVKSHHIWIEQKLNMRYIYLQTDDLCRKGLIEYNKKSFLERKFKFFRKYKLTENGKLFLINILHKYNSGLKFGDSYVLIKTSNE